MFFEFTIFIVMFCKTENARYVYSNIDIRLQTISILYPPCATSRQNTLHLLLCVIDFVFSSSRGSFLFPILSSRVFFSSLFLFLHHFVYLFTVSIIEVFSGSFHEYLTICMYLSGVDVFSFVIYFVRLLHNTNVCIKDEQKKF